MFRLLTLSIFLFSFISLQAQDHTDEAHDDHHDHHKNEIGIANSPVYFVKEKEFTYGLHIHYLRNIPHTKYSIGLGYEQIFDEHRHTTIGIVAGYRIVEGFNFNLSPGITFESEGEVNFALHLETTYEYEFGNIHIGPVLEFAYDPEDIHISLGLHIGYGF